jgi:hypothetical protein
MPLYEYLRFWRWLSLGCRDGGSKLLWNVGKYLPDYTVLHLNRQPLSYSQPENLKSHHIYSCWPKERYRMCPNSPDFLISCYKNDMMWSRTSFPSFTVVTMQCRLVLQIAYQIALKSIDAKQRNGGGHSSPYTLQETEYARLETEYARLETECAHL